MWTVTSHDHLEGLALVDEAHEASNVIGFQHRRDQAVGKDLVEVIVQRVSMYVTWSACAERAIFERS